MNRDDKVRDDHATAAPDAACLNRERAHFTMAERVAKLGYWRMSLPEQTLSWSPGMFCLVGLDPTTDVPERNWQMETVHPDDRGHLIEAVETAIRDQTGFQVRFRAGGADFPKTYETHGDIEFDGAGNAVAILGVCQDVTELVQAVRARDDLQEAYRTVAQEASDVISLHAPGGTVLFVSPAIERVQGIKADDFDIDQVFARVHKDDMEEAKRLRRRPGPGETVTATYRTRHGDGRYVWVETTIRAVYDDRTNTLKHTIGVSRDVTDRKNTELALKAAQERAEHANRSKSKFLANMSHELRTPLNAIIGFTDVMRQQMFGPLGSTRYSEYATLIYDSGQLLLDLISDILDMAKIEAGKLQLNYEPVDLNETINDCVRLMRDRADNRGVELSIDLPEKKVAFLADRRSVKQILLNLLSNAIKFTPPGGHVTIATSQENGTAALSVRDTGIGIPASELPRLGRPFEQAGADPLLSQTGTGLGLALVRALAEKHGGRFLIESQEGIGTTVTITLPLAPAKRAAA